MTVTCLLGPAEVQRVTPPATVADPMLAGAALDAGPARVVLVGDQPIAVGTLWHDLLAPLLADADAATLVHPGWWTPPMVELVYRAATALVQTVTVTSRAALLAGSGPGLVVVEIAEHAVLVTGSSGPLGLVRRGDGSVVERIADLVGSGPAIIDAPADIPGSSVLTGAVAAALSVRGVRVSRNGAERISAALAPPEQNLSRRPRWAVAAALTAGLVSAGVWALRPSEPDTRPVVTAALVEGRVTVQVPAAWTVQRVTTGPGSARVQVVSPEDPDVMLHLTQSRVPVQDLAVTATALRSAIDAEPAGTFVDFDPAGRRAGRPVVTYREVRPGRDIGWTVLVDADVRISIGCQSAPGRADTVAAACDDAVRTAQRLG